MAQTVKNPPAKQGDGLQAGNPDLTSGSGRSPEEGNGSVKFSCSVMSDFLWPHGLQHIRLSCPSPTSRVCSNSCPVSWWCHPTISPTVIPFSSCLQSFPALGSFPESQFFTSGDQSGKGYPLHYSCLENSMDRGAWGDTGHGFTKSQSQLRI